MHRASLFEKMSKSRVSLPGLNGQYYSSCAFLMASCIVPQILIVSAQNSRLVAPRAIWDQIFTFRHANRTGGHLGINRTAFSTRWFWWPGIMKDVIRWCRHCDVCQLRNLSNGQHQSSLHQEPVGAPMEWLAFDILSFPVETAEGNTCVLVICDYFTKWVEAFSLVDLRAVTVADVLVTEIFLRFGVPRYLLSDQAPEFMSELMTELCELLELWWYTWTSSRFSYWRTSRSLVFSRNGCPGRSSGGGFPDSRHTDGCDEDVLVDAESSVGHTPESNPDPSILEKECGPTPPAHQFPRRSSRKRCLPFHFHDYDMA